MAYVEQARVTADPSYYSNAEGALEKSLQLRPEGNDDALTASGALANARHEFEDAANFARRATRAGSAPGSRPARPRTGRSRPRK